MGELVFLKADIDKGACRGLTSERVKIARGRPIFEQGDAADHWFEVVSGVARACRIHTDGRRNLTAILFARDALGVESGDIRRTSAEAVTDVTLIKWSRRALLDAARLDPHAEDQTQCLLMRALDVAERRVTLSGLRSASERLAGFLMLLAGHSPAGAAIQLSMSRYDIADYLGLTVETVSRTFTQFVKQKWIALDGPHRVRLCEVRTLRRHADMIDDTPRRAIAGLN